MCQMCDEAKLYMAQLEAADGKAAAAPRDADGRKDAPAARPAPTVPASGRK